MHSAASQPQSSEPKSTGVWRTFNAFGAAPVNQRLQK